MPPKTVRGFGVPTKTPRTKHRQTVTGRAHSHVPQKRWAGSGKATTSLPPLNYNQGPNVVPIKLYDYQFWAIRGDQGDEILMTEVETATDDDSSAVMTGSLTFRFPEWAEKLGLREGHEIRKECSDDGGSTWTPLWTMRLLAPNSDLKGRSRTANLSNDLYRLQQSDDNFVYVKGKKKANGWRVDEVIRDICDQYQIEIATLPVMTARIKNWHLIDQQPLDVIHSALLREKSVTGNKFALSLDWQKRLHITAFRRPTTLWEIGPQIIAATGSASHDPRFATALTVRADPVSSATLDKKKHRKTGYDKIQVDVQSDAGVALYGYIHRNVYSPDANSNSDAQHEGDLFLAAIAKPKRQYTVTLPDMPYIRRLDAFKVVLPQEGISQIVYVSDVRRNHSGTSGSTMEMVLDFDDPFADNKALRILAKLSDTAVARSRKAPAKKTTAAKKTAAQAAHTTKARGFGVTTRTAKAATKRATTRAK